MSKTTFRLKKQLSTYARRGWIVIIVGMLAILMALPISSTLAAPNNQTVPEPTPENTPKPVPTATPTDRPDDGDDDDSSSQPAQPTQIPVSEDLTAVVNVERLNVRGGPSVQYDVVGKVYQDEVVTVIGRNEPGDWWFICCVVDTEESGWVSAQFLTPNFPDEQIDTLPIIPADGPPPTPEPAQEPVAEAVTDTVTAGDTGAITTTITTTTAAAMPMSALELSMDQSTPFAWQGQEVKLQYVITNSSDEDAANVELRNELPALLGYVDAAVSGGGEPVDSTLGNGATVAGARWPMVAAGEQVTATIILLISTDAPNGAVIQNIAVVGADNAESASAGVNIGMPPAALPAFK